MSTTTMTRNVAPVGTRKGGSLVRNGVMAGVLSAGANAAVFAAAVAVGVFPSLTFRPDGGAQMSVEPVVLVSVVGVLAAVAVFALLRRAVAKPVPVFLRIAAVVLLISFAAPFAIPGTAAAQAVVLNVQHVVVAAASVWAVLRSGSGRQATR